MDVSYRDLEADASQWVPNTEANVNPQAYTGLIASNLIDGRMLVTGLGDKPFAGGLVSRKLQVPQAVTFAGGAVSFPLVYARLQTYIEVPSFMIANLARLETDLIAVFVSGATTPSANKGNCSTQLNLSTGHFEVDASAGSAAWSDTGAGPGSVVPDVEHPLVIKCAFDLVNKKRSVQSIEWDETVYPVPASLQNILFQVSNWGIVASIQKQTEIFKPGSTAVIYRGTQLDWSDQPF